MDHRVLGTTMPALEIDLQPGEHIIAESGELSWMTQTINMRTSTGGAGGGGVFGVFKRAVSGGTVFLTDYSAEGGPGSVTFATKMPGAIIDLDVTPGNGFMVHRHGFICGTPGIEVTMGFQRKLGAGVFGGEGFVLQKLGGQAHTWVSLSGEVIHRMLGPGETLRVHPGHVGIFRESVSFDVTMMKGIANAIFGGDGIFLATLTGPGEIWLQTLPIPNLAHALIPYLPKPSGS